VLCFSEAHPADVALARQQTLADELTSKLSNPTLLVWRAQPALLVARRETRLPRFREACDQMAAVGWPIIVRKSGGEACPIGLGTVQVSTIEPASGATMNAKYEALTKFIQSKLGAFQIVSRTGRVPGAYCPGSYDLAVQGKKIAGMSQHWFRNRCGIRCVVTSASINIEEPPDALADAVNRFYENAGSSMRCQSTALTNLRLCERSTHMDAPNLVSAFMNQLVSFAALHGAQPCKTGM
jgi:lipoate-protein ligase A